MDSVLGSNLKYSGMNLEIFAAHCKDMMQAYPEVVPALSNEFRHAFAAIDQIRTLLKDGSESESKICQIATERIASIVAAHRAGKTAL